MQSWIFDDFSIQSAYEKRPQQATIRLPRVSQVDFLLFFCILDSSKLLIPISLVVVTFLKERIKKASPVSVTDTKLLGDDRYIV